MFAALGRPVILALFYWAEKEILRHFVCFIKPKFKILRSILAFSLLSRVIFLPVVAEASFLSSVFGAGDKVYAETSANTVKPPQIGSNSQNITLLEANVSSSSILQDKNSEQKNSQKEEVSVSSTELNIISDNAILPNTGPLGVSDESIDPDSLETSVYVIRKGDSLSAIAEMFEVSTNTILWANDMKKGDPLKEGDVLLILPISGVRHVVEKGQTLKSIAQKYKADVADIASFNGIAIDAALTIGDELIIPDGEINVDGPVKTSSKPTKTPTKNLSGYFINPAPGAIKTQGIHGKNAVDLAAPIGTPIRAAASGTVLVARMGWNGGYGGLVIIQHSNGTRTLYSHLSRLNTKTGQNVSQGETIAYMGNTGRVRASKGGNGSHVHFEVYGAKNPGATGSWAR